MDGQDQVYRVKRAGKLLGEMRQPGAILRLSEFEAAGVAEAVIIGLLGHGSIELVSGSGNGSDNALARRVDDLEQRLTALEGGDGGRRQRAQKG